MVGDSMTVTKQMYYDCETTSGLEPVFTLEYNRRINIEADPIQEDIVIPEPEKPWLNRRKNNYKAKRRNK